MVRKSVSFLIALFLAMSLPLKSDDNYLLPNLQFYLTPPTFDPYGAFSFLGEAGSRNFRGSGTYGVYFTPCQRFKLSGEYLAQRLSYEFQEHDLKRWVSQYALGARYEYLLPYKTLQNFELGGAYSHSFNRHLSVAGFPARLSGSDGGYGFFGFTINPWKCGYISANANYDYVKYHRRTKKVVSGWGGSAYFVQQVGRRFVLDGDVEFRKPFNFYEGRMTWNYCSGLSCGLYGNFTDGKKGLPDVVTVGLTLGYAFGPKEVECCQRCGDPCSTSSECYSRLYCDLSNWVSTPAVYLPIVLNVLDVDTCFVNAPTSTPIPSQLLLTAPPYFIPVASFFSSPLPLTFSATALPPGASIDPVTGVVFLPHMVDAIITVIGTNSCGSTSQQLVIINGT